LGPREQKLVAALQDSIPLVADPFGAVAETLGMPADSLLTQLKEWRDQGVLRRVALILKHRECGFRANGMCVWDVPDERVLVAGRRLAQSSAVTHCYQRERAPEFPGNLYAMIHTGNWAATQGLFQSLSSEANLCGGRLLGSLREFKKTSMRYFES
jgi:DNA-binding Lrp family transcriptional regulator